MQLVVGNRASAGIGGSDLADRALDAASAGRASLVADRLVALLAAEDAASTSERIGERCRALATIERLLLGPMTEPVRLGLFIDRLVTLRGIAGGGGVIRTSLADLVVDAGSVRAVWFVLCGLFDAVEAPGVGGSRVMIVIELDGDDLVVAFAVAGGERRPVATLAGSAALARVRELAGSLGGSYGRGTRDGMMVFGVTLPVHRG